MTEDLMRTVDAVILNTTLMKDVMARETNDKECTIMAGLVSTAYGQEANPQKYEECKKLLKGRTSFFSYLRGTPSAIVETKLMVQEDPAQYLERMMAVYEELKRRRLWSSTPNNVLASMILTDYIDGYNMFELINRYDTVYKILHAKHPIMVDDRDRVYLALLAVHGVNAECANEMVETNYRTCKKMANYNEAAYSMAQILALSPYDTVQNAENIEKIMELLKLSARKIDKEAGLPFYAALSFLEENLLEETVLAVCEVDDYLSKIKGFKNTEIEKKKRILFASCVVLIDYCNRAHATQPVVSNTMMEVLIDQMVLEMIEATQAAAAAATM